jgi:deazaflavin-dependent oxidoreductase (nitroreductase family)
VEAFNGRAALVTGAGRGIGLVVAQTLLTLLGAYIVGFGLFERLAPRRWVRRFQRSVNPWYLWWTGRALGWAVIETTGRRTGLSRLTPIGGRLRGGVYWAVAGDGLNSGFVRNITANHAVRIRVHGRWRTGRAAALPDDNARKRLLRLNPINSLFLLIASRDPVTIRIDLDTPSTRPS